MTNSPNIKTKLVFVVREMITISTMETGLILVPINFLSTIASLLPKRAIFYEMGMRLISVKMPKIGSRSPIIILTNQ